MALDRKTRWYRRLIVAFLVMHSLSGLGSMTRGTAQGAALRGLFRPYESFLGVYQRWNMFAPVPPQSDQWSAVRHIDASGAVHSLPAIHGAREPATVEWYYHRRGKLERNLLPENRRRYLKMFARSQCEAIGDGGWVAVDRVQRKTPSPLQRQQGQAPQITAAEIVRVACP